MRVCLLGFDGLEWTLARNYKFLKQVEHHKTNIDIKMKPASTPSLWTTIITGQLPEVHGVDKIGWAGWSQTPKCSTLFDIIEGSIPLDVPCVNSKEARGGLERARRNPELRPAFAEMRWKLLRAKAEKTLELLEGDAPFVMTHFWTFDLLGHLFAWSEKRTDKLYKYGADLARSASRILKDGCVIVASDHGIEFHRRGHRGTHTNYGFLSFSKRQGLRPPIHIKDLFNIILTLTGYQYTRKPLK